MIMAKTMTQITPNHTKLPIVLASTSPRRAELLTTAGVDFVVQAAEIDETWQPQETALAYIERMVKQKSLAAAPQHAACLLITADTIGVLADGRVLTKPKDFADACRMWASLSDTTHEIWTAVCVSHVKQGKIIKSQQICERTEVDFVAISQAMQDAYWQTGEPQDKAGAYAIQGGAMAWVRAIRGSYTNVVGLPLAQTLSLIEQMQTQANK